MMHRLVVLAMSATLLMVIHLPLASQLLPAPVHTFERTHWGMRPESLRSSLSIRWMADPNDRPGSQSMMSGLEGVYSKRGTIPVFGRHLMCIAEFSVIDSGMRAFTIVAIPLGDSERIRAMGFSVEEELIDSLWTSYVDRFGEEDNGGKWIPLVGKSKKWPLDSVTVKIARLSFPKTALMIQYFRHP